MPNLVAAIWLTILNIKLLYFPMCVPELLLSHLPKFNSNVTIKNVSWPHFSWPTLYIITDRACASLPKLLHMLFIR